MADLPYIQEAQEVKITGQDSAGNTVNYVNADANGNMLVKDYSNGPVTPGSAAAASSLAGGQYNSTLPTLTTTQQSALQLDSSGRLYIRPLTSTVDSIDSIISGYSYSGYSPDPGNYPVTSDTKVSIDASGRLETHSTVTTDEGSFRDDFSGTGLTVTLTGSVTFTNGSNIITGTGSFFTSRALVGQWVKKSTDSETLYLQILEISNDNTIYCNGFYAGTTATTTAVVSNWNTLTNGTITVASSIVTLGSGTVNGNITRILRPGDYLPYTLNIYTAISQRIANQTSIVGFSDSWPTPSKQATVQFIGTTNTQVNFVTSFSSAAADTQTTTVTLPNGGNTSTYHTYTIDLQDDQANLSIDGVIVATNMFHIPGPYDNLQIGAQIQNSATVTNTNLTVDYFYFSNADRVQIGNKFAGDPLIVSGQIASGQTNGGNPLKIAGVYNSSLPTFSSGQIAEVQVDSNGRLLTTSSPGFASDRSVIGTINANAQTSAINTQGSGTTVVNTTGTWVGTLQLEGTTDGTNWVTIDGITETNSINVNQLTTNQTLFIATAGFQQVRMRSIAWTSGTVTIAWNASVGAGIQQVYSTNQSAFLVTSYQGTSPWVTNITQINGSAISLGQKTMANSLPVVLSSDQSVLSTKDASSGTISTSAGSTAMQIAGKNGSGNLTPILTDAGGRIAVDLFDNAGNAINSTGNALNVSAAVTSLPALPTGTNSIGAVTQATASNFNAQVVGNVADGTADSGNSVKIGGVYDTSLPVYINGQRGNLQLDVNGRVIVTNTPTDGIKTTYSAAASFTTASTPTDIFTLIGSSSKTIRITRIEITGTQTTAAMREILFIKRSTANTGGTSATSTAVSHDSSNAAATAVASSYTANPTSLGTAVGTLKQIKLWVSTTATQANYVTFDFGTRPEQCIVLRGTTQVFAINLNSATSAGNSFDISITWTEE